MSISQMSEVFTNQYKWVKDGDIINGVTYDGKITIASTTPTVTERDDATIEAIADAYKVIIRPPSGTVAMEIRFRGNGTTADQHVIDVYAAAGVDHYDLVETLTIDQGTQIDTGIIYFFDTIGEAGEKWITATSALSTSTNNIGRWLVNVYGYDRFLFLATTLDLSGGSPNADILYIDWRRF